MTIKGGHHGRARLGVRRKNCEGMQYLYEGGARRKVPLTGWGRGGKQRSEGGKYHGVVKDRSSWLKWK